jgi:hypothetical protein
MLLSTGAHPDAFGRVLLLPYLTMSFGSHEVEDIGLADCSREIRVRFGWKNCWRDGSLNTWSML